MVVEKLTHKQYLLGKHQNRLTNTIFININIANYSVT
jgi:hypothetical protein